MNAKVITTAAVAVLLSVATAMAQEAVPQTSGEAREKAYTAQRRPRVGVMEFGNSNELANKEKFGASVSDMLVTFLKRKSQLVAVERQRDSFGRLLEQWRMRSTGVTAAPPADPTAPPTAPPTFSAPVTVQSPGIEDIDAILEGRVTLFGNTETRPDGSTRVVSMEVEIDARLIAPDAHIISAANRRGPASSTCLRQTVESLGIELEQGFLRPYYGSLNVTVDTPSNVRIFLTPVLREGARDDERPPVELDQTVSPQAQGGRNEYDRWVTTPRVATISNILVGWYTIRVDRPGFVGLNTDNSRIIIDASGQPVQASSRAPVTKEQERFLVHIKPFETATWPKDDIPVRLEKRWGTLAVKVKREFLDADFVDAAKVDGFKSYIAALHLDMNRTDDVEMPKPAESAAAAGCGDTAAVKRKNLERVDACSFKVAQESFETYRGGPLTIEDYQAIPAGDARKLPVGGYALVAVAPGYEFVRTSEFDVAHGVRDRDVFVELRRIRGQITITRAGDPDPNYRLYFEGRETKHKHSIPLDFTGARTIANLPIDSYTIYTDEPGFAKWRRRVDLKSDSLQARSDTVTCAVTYDKAPASIKADVDLKTQPWLAGRLNTMNTFVSPNVSRRSDISSLLERVIANEEQRKPDSRPAASSSQQLLVGGGGATAGEKEAAALLGELRERMRDLDLLYLDDVDVRRILGVPAVAGVVREYVENGGAIFAFVSTPADYASLFGASINIDTKRQVRDEMELRQGDVPTVVIDTKLEFPIKREFPSIRTNNKEPLGDWRVVSYRKKGRKEPIILERGNLETGGYVLVWVDSLSMLPDHQLTQQAVSAAEKRALAWSQYLMYRRLGPESPERRDAQSKLQTLRFDAVGEAKIVVPKLP